MQLVKIEQAFTHKKVTRKNYKAAKTKTT